MRRKNIMITMLAVSMVLVGTAYAYWTDTLNVTAKATSGDMNVTFVDLGAYAQYTNEMNRCDWSIIDGVARQGHNGYVKADFFMRGTNTYNDVFGNPDKRDDYYAEVKHFNSVDFDAALAEDGQPLGQNYPALPYGAATVAGDKINIEINKMYPGYAQAFRSDIINIGSVAAKLSKVNFAVDELANKELTDEMKGMIGVALLVQDENPETYGEIVKLANQFAPADKFRLGGVDFVRLSALEREVAIEENLILVPGGDGEHRADLFLGIAMDPDASGVYTTGTAAKINYDNDDAASQNKGVQLSIDFLWDQFNVGVNANTTNILEKQN